MTESPGVLFERLLDIMARLRGPDGCPWDREQTRTSLKPYLIEEAYEVLEAIEARDAQELEAELGDLLFQVIFHARLAEEIGEFTMADLLRRLLGQPHLLEELLVASRRDGGQEGLDLLARRERREELDVSGRCTPEAEPVARKRLAHGAVPTGARRRSRTTPDPSPTPPRISARPRRAFTVSCSSRKTAP